MYTIATMQHIHVHNTAHVTHGATPGPAQVLQGGELQLDGSHAACLQCAGVRIGARMGVQSRRHELSCEAARRLIIRIP